MRYSDMRARRAEADELLAKKRQKQRLVTLLDVPRNQPPATPPRPATGLDEHGQSAGDRCGNVYALHIGKPIRARASRRAIRFGSRGGIQPLRSRIQRLRRKRRTGGVK
jgi:hypothetical protein